MKIMHEAGLIKIEPKEWSTVKETLLAKGYVWWSPGGYGVDRCLWTSDHKICLSEHFTEPDKELGGRKQDCYYLDIRVLRELEGL